MKKNLIKILALSAIVVSLGACNKKKGGSDTGSDEEVAKVVDIAELLTLDPADKTKWELEGQLVKIENLACGGIYGNTVIGNTSVGKTVVDLRGLEIQSKEAVPFTSPSKRPGYGSDITAEGRVVNVNGRLTLQEATVTINSQRGEDGKYTDDAGLPVHYCPAVSESGIVTNRSLWDGYFSGRQYSGACVEALVQLASLPGSIADNDTSFYVVFPGEDMDVNDDENGSLIKVNIPAASLMSEGAVSSFNSFFAGKSVGDFVAINGLLQYDSQANGGMGFIIENYWNQIGYTNIGTGEGEIDPSYLPTIVDSWAAVAAEAQDYFADPFINLSSADPNSPLLAPFSYQVDDSYVDEPDGFWTDAYKSTFCQVADLRHSAMYRVIANFKASKFESYVEAIDTTLLAAGYVADEEWASEGIVMYLLKDGSGNVEKEVLLMANNEQQIELHYTALKAGIISAATFADTITAFDANANAYIEFLTGTPGSLHSELCDIDGTVAYTLDVSGIAKYYQYYTQLGMLAELKIEFDQPAATTKEQLAVKLAAYKADLIAAGYNEAYLSTFGATGLCNASTKEFVFLFSDDSTKTIYAQVIVLDATSYAAVSYPYTNEAQLIAAINDEYAGWNGASSAYFPSTASTVTSFTLGSKAAIAWDFLDTDKDDMDSAHGYTPYFVATVHYAENLVQADVDLFIGALTAAGFVGATIDGIGHGYFNSTTYEFITVAFEGDTLSVGFGLVPTVVAATVVVLD